MSETGNYQNGNITTKELYWRPEKGEPFILENIESIFEKGYIYGIIGPNGSGKTSLIRNLLRFVDSTKGVVRIDEQDIRSVKRKKLARKLALVPQHTKMDASFTAYDIVMMGRTPYQKRFSDASREDEKFVLEAMRLTDCYQYREKEVSLLSGGEAQRVATARAIAQDTDWLILDEPTASLDVKHQVELMRSLIKLKKQKGKSIITILHDINIASEYCDRIVIMKEGKIHSQGPATSVLTCENLADVYGISFELLMNPENKTRYFIPSRENTQEDEI